MTRDASAKEREGEAGRPHPTHASGLLPRPRPGPCSARAYIWWAAVPGSSPVYPPRLQDTARRPLPPTRSRRHPPPA